MCLAARFMVFENEIDLRAHEVQTHGQSRSGGGTSTKINLEFRVRRSGYDGEGYENQDLPREEDFQFGLDGEAFVPDSLPERQENEPVISDANHAARTAELREEAALLRVGNVKREEEEAFPELGGGTERRGLIGWTADGQASARKGRTSSTVRTAENFPALTASSRMKTNSGRGGQAASGRATSGSLAAIEATASAHVGMFSSSARATSAASPFFSTSGGSRNSYEDLSADNFPSLGPPSNTAYGRSVVVSNPASSLAAVTAAASRRSTGSPEAFFALPSQLAAPNNKKENLTVDNFPSLGPPIAPPRRKGGGRSGNVAAKPAAQTYAAADALAKKLRQKNGPSEDSFLLGLESATEATLPPAGSTKAPARSDNIAQKPPSQDVLNFPPPPSSAGNSTQQNQATVDSIKATLGSVNYKKLKVLTKGFAKDDINPEKYVDQSVALFEGGIHDPAFWSFVPGVIESCPNSQSTVKAMKYLKDLQHANNVQSLASTLAGSGYTTTAETVAQSGLGQYAAADNFARKLRMQGKTHLTTATTGRSGLTKPLVHGKKKTPWAGGNGPTAAVLTKNTRGAVGAAAVVQDTTPQIGTATKGMAALRAEARRQKQLESQLGQGSSGASNGGNKPTKKNKQKTKNNELRSLAFGGK